MLNNKVKLKILLIQLPVAQYTLWKHWGNIPLAAGYLKAMCYKMGLLEKVDIEILDEQNSNLAADARLIDVILSKSPDILGFSLYCWNSMRSLFIARKIKSKLPNVRVIVGGAEVTTSSKYLLDVPVIDIGCSGEGEFTFAEIISYLLQNKKDFKGIKGIFYRKNNKIIVTPPRPIVKTLDVIPSPYLLGIINPKDYGRSCIETKRGCPYRCTYCAERLRPLRFFSPDRIQQEIQLSISKEVYNIELLDSSFLTNPNFREICQVIKNSNANKKLFISTALRAEDLNKKTVDLLKGCGIQSIELGLQSCNATVLRNIDRPTNLKKFIDGVYALEKKNIWFTIDLIIGLPGETLESFKETVGFLKDNKLISHVITFPLAILPGTKLEKDKDKYGIKHHQGPPYIVFKTSSLSESDIQKCYETLGKAKHKERGNQSGPYPLTIPMTSYLRIDYLLPKEPNKKQLSNINIRKLNFPITKIIVELDAKKQNLDSLDLLGKKLRRKIGNPLTIWFLSQNIELGFELIESFLKCISTSNPYLVWNIFLETQSEFNLSIIDKIKKCITVQDGFLNNPIRVFAILPFKKNKLSNQWLNELSKELPIFWNVEFSEKLNSREEIGQILKEKNKLFVVDFHPNCRADFIVKILKLISKRGKNPYFLFKDVAINHLQKNDSSSAKNGIPLPKKLYETILRFNKKLQLTTWVLPNMNLKRNMTIWRYIVLKKLTKS